MIKLSLGGRIKFARENSNLKQEELADKLNMARLSIINYEKDFSKPKSSILIKIADICGVSDIWLLTGDEKDGIFLNKNNVVKETTQTYNNKDEMIEFLFAEVKKRDAIIKDLETEKELWRGKFNKTGELDKVNSKIKK